MTPAPAAPLLVGGQAVIEGVMMRSPRFVSVAVRRSAGDLLVETRRALSLVISRHWLGLPVLRGIIVLFETLVLGARAIMFAANAAAAEEHRPLTPREMGLSMAAALALAIGLFFVLPTLAVRALERAIASPLALNLIEGGLRMAFVVGYIGFLGRVPDLRRVYEYHGAEHKAVNAFEAGLALEPDAVRGCSRFHPRCGTSFIILVMLVAVAAFAFLGRPGLVVRILERLLLLPVIAGASYELLRLAARTPAFRPLALPGIWLQHLTTREPDVPQLEVAIRALREVLDAEAAASATPAAW